MNMKERQMSFARKKSRRYTHDVLRATIESETDDFKRFPFLLRRQCEERISPWYPDVHTYMVKDDWEAVFIEKSLTTRKSVVPLDTNKVDIYAYGNMDMKLRALDCRCPNIIDTRLFFAIVHTLTYFPNIFSLQLVHCNLNTEHILILKENLSSKATITELNLTGNPNGYQSFHYLMRLGLKVLVLKFCNIGEKGLQKMAREYLNHPYDPPSLIHLDLSHNPVFDEGCKYISSILKCDRTLRSLNLTDTKIRDSGLTLLALSFRNFPLSDEEIGVRRKIRLDYFRMLQPKSSSESAIKAEAETALASALTEPKIAFSLVETAVKRHPFTNDTVQEAGEIFGKGNCTLEHLNISYNQLSKSSLDLLLKTLMEQTGTFEGQKGLRQLVLEGICTDKLECDTLKMTIKELLAGKNGCNRSLPGSLKGGKLSIKRRKSSGASSTASGLSSRDRHNSIFA